MKEIKNYKVMLYQVSSAFGYVKEGMTIGEIDYGINEPPVISSVEFREITPIIVEKYSPFLVREVITGLVFPIVNVHAVSSKLNSMYYVEKPMQEAHTFVISKGEKLLSSDVSQKELEKYINLHQDNCEFKRYLKQVVDIGKENADNIKSGKRRVLKTK